MSSSVFARRAARALAVAVVLLLGAGARAASAATVFVDDDHAQCPFAGFRSLSAALATVGAGATVEVCPGTYVERVRVTRAGVRVVGLTGNPADVVMRPTDPIGPTSAIVELSGPATALSAVTVEGKAPASLGCGPFTGVLVHNGAGPFSNAAVIDNVRLRQIVQSSCPPRFGPSPVGIVIGDPAGAGRPGRAIVRNSSYMAFGSGIVVNPGSRADIHDNVLAHPPGGGPSFPPPAGIVVIAAVADIEHNEVSGFWVHDEDGHPGVGIWLRRVHAGTVGGSPSTGNLVHHNGTGVMLASSGFSVAGVTIAYNRVTFSEHIGIESEASGNTFLHNVVTNNGQLFGQPDCIDAVGANTWIDNVGSVTDEPSFPPDICPPRIA